MESGSHSDTQYAKNSHMQAAMAKGAVEYLRLAGRAAALSGAPLVRIADFGCSVGNNSARDLQAAVEAVQSVQGPENQVCVYSVDLPGNDWRAFFENVRAGYGSGGNVYSYAATGSFYDRVFPNDYIHIGYSAASLHWMSTTVPTHGNVFCNLDPVVKAAAARVAARDWLAFLRAWASQSAAGAHCIVVLPSDAREAEIGRADAMRSAWRSMAADGVISHDDLQRLNLPIYPRSAQELKEPFENDPAISATFDIIALEDAVTLSPRLEALAVAGMLDEFAESIARMVRTVFSPTFRQELQHLGNVEAVLDEWTRRTLVGFRSCLKKVPARDFGFIYSHIIVFRKR